MQTLPPPPVDHARSLTNSVLARRCCSSTSEISRPTASGRLVVTERGLKIFVGSPGAMHSPREFVAPARNRELPSELRQLAGVKDHLPREARKSQSTLAGHDSVLEFRTLDQSEPRKVIDARGRRLTLVGGYAPLAEASNDTTAGATD
jgi:hypothetical protein